MKIDVLEKIEIPEGIELEINEETIKVSGNGKENRKNFNLKNIEVKRRDNTLILESKKSTKRERKMINTIRAHINNMIKGLQENFVYKLEITYVHFPMTVKHDESKKEIVIDNFFGEKKQRVCKVIDNVEVKVDKKFITVESHNKELAGQMAANLEKATKIRNKDRRKFQDGIYITEKCGKAI